MDVGLLKMTNFEDGGTRDIYEIWYKNLDFDAAYKQLGKFARGHFSVFTTSFKNK